ncbi:MAG: VWA domain-containing protein [Anaerolineae bacterium]
MNNLKMLAGIIGLLVLSLIAAQCGGSAPDAARSEPAVETGPPLSTEAGGETLTTAAEPVVVEKEVEAIVEGEFREAAPAEAPAPIAHATPAPTMALADRDASTEEAAPRLAADQQYQPLRAGEVDDNQLWDDYLLYRLHYEGPYIHDLDVSERYVIDVRDRAGQPVLDARVTVFAGDLQGEPVFTGRTYATGQTLFHPQAMAAPDVDRFTVWVEKDGGGQTFVLERHAQETWPVTLDVPAPDSSINLDVLFLIDATGSMADEIAKIQDSIFDVAARIDALPTRPDVRYGLVTYRDRGDAYVTRATDFTPDVTAFHQSLLTVVADGGGDYPESLNEGLHEALTKPEWRGQDTVKLVFLVADAPPHLDYAQDYDYAQEMIAAARRGIKIFSIASSGLDDQGEYIFRQLAQFTQGRFIFLTYADDSNGGLPGDVTTHHVDEEDYSVENLDDLLVKLVTEELAYQDRQLAQQQ